MNKDRLTVNDMRPCIRRTKFVIWRIYSLFSVYLIMLYFRKCKDYRRLNYYTETEECPPNFIKYLLRESTQTENIFEQRCRNHPRVFSKSRIIMSMVAHSRRKK